MQKDYIVAQVDWTDRWDRMRTRLGDTVLASKNEKFRLMKPWLDRMPSGGRILDGGCGLGHWTLLLRSLGFETEGIDISEPTIELLRTQYPEIPFSVQDIRKTNYPNSSFDAYFSWGTFEHFEGGMEAPMREAWRILKPGGLLILTVPFQNLRHIMHGAPDPKSSDASFYQWRFTKRELAIELQLRDFKILSITTTSKDQGAFRTAINDFHLRKGNIPQRAATKLFKTITPASWIAHMLFVVAQKPK